MSALLDIDPLADAERTISAGRQSEKGKASDEMRLLGTDTPLTLKTLKTQYDAIGSFLHQPTLGMLDRGMHHDAEALRSRLKRLLSQLDATLASKIFNFTVGRFSTCTCGRCGVPIRRRLPREEESTTAKCPECSAGYILTVEGDGVTWSADDVELQCATSDCDGVIVAFSDEVVPGRSFVCTQCGQRSVIGLGVWAASDA
ncbi:hypothetical protein [Caulobacter sp. NIBR2454]|uniref:hypothetical protein n=1 Tax=Caulobacter sp. NIBR2454 TaxID=3015996 RepID=UPI0022B6B17D|nr:hypothetical protein [Caulobacter sp. NIBR2454]